VTPTAAVKAGIDVHGKEVTTLTAAPPPHELHGSGPRPVIALHGWFGDRTSYRPLMRWIDAESFTYALMDQRGYGDSRATDGAFTVEEIAGDAIALADCLGWKAFSVVGHSMGGKVAQRLVADAPDRVTALVGISPVPASGAGMDDDVFAFFAGARDDADVRRAIIDRTTGGRLPGAWLDATVRCSLECSTAQAFGRYLSSWSRGDFHEKIRDAGTPALFIVGEHDPELSADTMRETVLRWFRNARLVSFANAGHYAMDETPLDLVATVEQFLRQATEPSS
jgi:pimeloyl-ACP methyl ester carboxylesterase